MLKKVSLVLLTVFTLAGCTVLSTVGGGQDVVKKVTEVDKVISKDEVVLKAKNRFISAIKTVSDMGTGWNLGNTLDSCDYKKYTPENAHMKKYDYQIMAMYENTPWSAWDASEAIYFDGNGKVRLEWKIDNLKSAANGKCGKFSFQIINHKISSIGKSPLKFTVTKAELLTKSGTIIKLEDMQGDFKSVLKKGVSKYVVSNLTHIKKLNKAKDIIGGTLLIEVKITKYPVPRTKNREKSAVEYYETLWGNPVTTKKMIDKVAEAGFKSVRIPITYYDHMVSQGTIDEAWLVRIKEIVDYVLANNMYCIINIHHDAGKGTWLQADLNTIKEQKLSLKALWMQIAEYFKNYNEKLLFEGFNEILNTEDEWTNAGIDAYEAVNQLNQQFVDTVRSTGGNNSERNLIVNSYAAASNEDILSAFAIPTDRAKHHLIGGIHYYSELEKDNYTIEKVFERLNKTFIEKGIPVVIGEFASKSNWDEEDSIAYIGRFMEEAKANNFAVFWWDRGGTRDTGIVEAETLFDRNNLTWYSDDILEAVLSE